MKTATLGLAVSLFILAYPRAAAEPAGSPASASPAGLFASVIHTEGAPKLIRRGETQAAECVAGTEILKEDRLITGTADEIEISFDEDDMNVIKISELSDVVITSNEPPYYVDLAKGEILAVVKRLPANSSFEVRTPAAVAGVRGTEWATRMEGETASFDVFDNAIFVKGLSEKGEASGGEVEVRSGYATEVVRFSRPQPPRILPPASRTRWQQWRGGLDRRIEERKKLRPPRGQSPEGRRPSADAGGAESGRPRPPDRPGGRREAVGAPPLRDMPDRAGRTGEPGSVDRPQLKKGRPIVPAGDRKGKPELLKAKPPRGGRPPWPPKR